MTSSVAIFCRRSQILLALGDLCWSIWCIRVWAQLFKYEWILSKALNIHVLGFAWVDDLAVRRYIYQLPYSGKKVLALRYQLFWTILLLLFFFFLLFCALPKYGTIKTTKQVFSKEYSVAQMPKFVDLVMLCKLCFSIDTSRIIRFFYCEQK